MSTWSDVTYASCRAARPELSVGKVVKVYDGDSITIGTLDKVRYSCRLSGIDTAELRSSSTTERDIAYASRDFLREKILHMIVDVVVRGIDKYGRLLCVIELDGVNINDLMITSGGAIEYNGGKKRNVDWGRIDVPVGTKRRSFTWQLCCFRV